MDLAQKQGSNNLLKLIIVLFSGAEVYDKSNRFCIARMILNAQIYFLADVNSRFKGYLHALDIRAKGNQLEELFLLVNRVALRSHITTSLLCF